MSAPVRCLLEILEHEIRPEHFDGLTRDELFRFNRALFRWHSELRARLNGKPRQTAALLGIRISPRQEIRA